MIQDNNRPKTFNNAIISSNPPSRLTISARRVFFGLSSFQILAMFRRGLFYSYLSIYLRSFLGLSVTETTLFATLPMILNITSQTFVWGPISDKFQRRRTLVIMGETLAGLGTIIVWYVHVLADNLILAGYAIILGLSIVEIFWSMSNCGWSALISDLYPAKDRGDIQGRISSVGGLGRIGGVWIGGLLYDGLQLQYPGWGFHSGWLFIIAALVMFLSTIPMFFAPEGGIKREPQTQELPRVQIAENPTGTSQIFIVFLIAMIFINFGRNSVAVIISQYLDLDSGFAVSSELLSYIVNTQSLAIIIMGFGVGWIGRRIGNGKTVLLGAGLAMIGLLLFAIADNLILIFIGNFFRGCSQVIVIASSYAFASVLIPPKNRARLFAVFNATFFLSWGLAGTFIAGPLIDILLFTGYSEVFAYQMAFLAALGITFVGFLIHGVLLIGMRQKLKKWSTNDSSSHSGIL
ncbi:MAG: MFS transporter [Candidatus Hermodarchaeota archaeon]